MEGKLETGRSKKYLLSAREKCSANGTKESEEGEGHEEERRRRRRTEERKGTGREGRPGLRRGEGSYRLAQEGVVPTTSSKDRQRNEDGNGGGTNKRWVIDRSSKTGTQKKPVKKTQ